MGTNNFLPFCGTDTGTNLPTQGDYAVDPNRDIGAQPGVASSKLNNKPIRQATAITSQLAQYIADKTTVNVLDDGNMTKLLAQMNACFLPIAAIYTKYTSGSGTHNVTYYFFISSGNATAGATYTNNGVTYTVKSTISSGTLLATTANGDPAAISGTLTKSGGTGDTTLSFYAYRKPIRIDIEMWGGGGGASGSGSSAGSAATAGGNTTFGTTLLVANGGSNAAVPTGGTAQGGAGGTINLNGVTTCIGIPGNGGGGAQYGAGTAYVFGGMGGAGPYGGAPATNNALTTPPAAGANSGAGGSAPGVGSSAITAGAGGGSGGFVKGSLFSPLSSYAYAVGAAGTGGGAGTSGQAGSNGGAGAIALYEVFQ